ncbi:MAG: universal stress protein [Chloroflexota bacterium]
MYKHILCATRGGEKSEKTEERAIRLAWENQAGLTFLYAVDPAFAQDPGDEPGPMSEPKGLHWLGELVLEMAARVAERQGVQAQQELRQGEVIGQIKEYLAHHPEVDLLVMGAPAGEAKSHFSDFVGEVVSSGREFLIVE